MLYINVDVDIGKYLNHRPRLYNIPFCPRAFLKENTTETGTILPCYRTAVYTTRHCVCVCVSINRHG